MKFIVIYDKLNETFIQSESINNFNNIDQLFEFINDKYNNSAYLISVDYDENYNFVNNCDIDEILNAVDDEIAFSVSKFETLSNGFLIKNENTFFIVHDKLDLNINELDVNSIILIYGSCEQKYVLNNSAEYGYYYNGNIYQPENLSLLRYSEEGIFTEDYVVCRISISGNEIKNDLFVEYEILPENEGKAEIEIKGNNIVGQLLTSSIIINDPNGNGNLLANGTYQWKSNNINITNANETSYLLTNNDVGKNISLTINYVDSDGFSETVNSNYINNIKPIDEGSAEIQISGNNIVGELLNISIIVNDPDGNGNLLTNPFINGRQTI